MRTTPPKVLASAAMASRALPVSSRLDDLRALSQRDPADGRPLLIGVRRAPLCGVRSRHVINPG